MIVLALDTAGIDCAAALYDSETGRVLAEVCETIGKGHAERLMAMIDEALAASGLVLADLDRVAVTVGPGSFTGIRVGVAAARALALALGIEAVGVTTLAVLAAIHRETGADQPVFVAMDAKRGEVYAQVFAADGAVLSEPVELAIADAEALPARYGAAVAGSGAPLLAGAAEGSGPDHFSIAHVARLGADLQPGAARPKPLYLRAPDAKPQTGFALSRA